MEEDDSFETYDFFFSLTINIFNGTIYYLLGRYICRFCFLLLMMPFYNVTVEIIWTIYFFLRKSYNFLKKFFVRKKKIEKIRIISNKSIVEFKNWILSEIINPISEEKKKNKEEDSFFSFLKKKSKNSILLEGMSKEEIKILDEISLGGWYKYDSDISFHRKVLFLLLKNYFNFLTRKSFNKFIKAKKFGINFYESKEEYKVYFYYDSIIIPSHDPIISVLYLLIHVLVYEKGKLGEYQLKNLPFLNK